MAAVARRRGGGGGGGGGGGSGGGGGGCGGGGSGEAKSPHLPGQGTPNRQGMLSDDGLHKGYHHSPAHSRIPH
eukprot:gene17874-biopygen5592